MPTTRTCLNVLFWYISDCLLNVEDTVLGVRGCQYLSTVRRMVDPSLLAAFPVGGVEQIVSTVLKAGQDGCYDACL